MRLTSPKKLPDSTLLESFSRPRSRLGDYLVIAAGGLAMLLTVGAFDMLGLLS